MARIRSVKPEYWDDRKLAKRTSRDARLLYIALWNLADEHCRLNGDPQWIKGQVFSYDDDLNADAIAKMLEELAAVDAVMAYEADGDPYLYLPKLAKHQRLEPEKVKSRLPEPPGPSTPPPAPEPPPFEPDTSQSAPHSDESARDPDESARGRNKPAPHANTPALLYVAGSREHVAGSRVARAHAVPNAPTSGPTEIPDDFQPSDAMRRWANVTYPGLDLDFETAQFKRHWRAEGRRKKSWPDAWQKWIADSHQKRNSRASPAAADRRQQATDDQFDRAMERARAREGTT